MVISANGLLLIGGGTNDDSTEIDTLIDRLYQAGCDDALIGSGRAGVVGLMFTREAENATQAFISAINDVKNAIPSAKLVEAKPDFAGVSDIAEFIGCSRQNILKLFANTEAPMPVHSSGQSYWHLSEALTWLSEGKRRERYNIPTWQLDVAQTAKAINFAIEETRVVPQHFI
jgi:predicted DNA-binding transcriptional regulator AlpA